MTITREQIFSDINNERKRQDEKWGEQHHPDGTSYEIFNWLADQFRNASNTNDKNGELTWTNILEEEVYEALSETDQAMLRKELIQVMAVCCAWVEDIDGR